MSYDERRRSVRFSFDGQPIPAAIESASRNFRVTGSIGDISYHGCKIIGARFIGPTPKQGEDVVVEFSCNNHLHTYGGLVRRIDSSMGCIIIGAEFSPPLPHHIVDSMFPECIGHVVCSDVKKHHYRVEGMLGEMVVKPISWIAKRYRSSAVIDLKHVDRWDSRGVFAIALAQQYGVRLINIPGGIPIHEV